MLESDLIQSTSSWPFVEIRKLLKERKKIIEKKNKITFQTGYGPSGLPHIGTFGEVSRTSMMINALNHIRDIESELIKKLEELAPNSNGIVVSDFVYGVVTEKVLDSIIVERI